MEAFDGVSPHRPIATGSEIRVVIVHPGEFGEPIICKLQHIHLVPDSDYEAVSYAWGDDSVRNYITLDNLEYPVTTNLFTGLQYLRHKDTPRTLWVDSLCINQSDKVERGQEVQKMRDIYKFARAVIVWIGDYKPYSRGYVKDIFHHLEYLASCGRAERQDKYIRHHKYDQLWRSHSITCEFICSRPWFQRMWVIQEVSVRPNVGCNEPDRSPQIHCGNLRLPAIYLRDAIAVWETHKQRHTILALPPIMTSVWRLYIIWAYYHKMRDGQLHTNPPLGVILSWILATVAGEFHCTDSRDMIYAILGLLPGSLPQILAPDYFKPPPQVLWEYAIYILETVGLLDIIQYTSGSSTEMPSWVPDWKASSPHAIGPSNRRHPDTYIRIVADGKGLELELLAFTKVKHCGPNMTPVTESSTLFASLDKDFRQAENAFLSNRHHVEDDMNFRRTLYELLLRFDLHQRQLHDPEFHENASRRGFCQLPGYEQHLRLACIDNQVFADMRAEISQVESLHTEELWRSIIDTVRNKYLFCCIDGTVGILAQSNIKPAEEDVVCTFKGACGEFIVRPCVGGYRLIGRCERTVKGFDCKIDDVDVHVWINGAHTLRISKALWTTRPTTRVVIW